MIVTDSSRVFSRRSAGLWSLALTVLLVLASTGAAFGQDGEKQDSVPSAEELAELKRMAMEMLKKSGQSTDTQPSEAERLVQEELARMEQRAASQPTTQPTTQPTDWQPAATTQPTTQPATQPARPTRGSRRSTRAPRETAPPVTPPAETDTAPADDDVAPRLGRIPIPLVPEGKFPWDMPEDFRPFVLDWADEDLVNVVDDFGRQTGLTIMGQEVIPDRKKVTYHGMKNMNYWEAMKAVNSILAQHDLILVRQQLNLLVKEVSAIREALGPENIINGMEAFDRANLHDEELVLLFFYPPEGITITDFEQTFLSFLPHWVRLDSYGDSGILQITAKAGDIRKMMSLLNTTAEIGGVDPRVLKFIQLEYAPASEVLQKIQQMIDMGNGAADAGQARGARRPRNAPAVSTDNKLEQVDIAADDVVNMLIVRALPKKLSEIEQFALDIDQQHKGDQPGEPEQIRLRFATASEVTQTVSSLIGEQPGAATPRRTTSRRRAGVQATPMAGPGGSTIIPDDRTNTLFITTDEEEELVRIRALVRMLDVPAGDDNFERVALTHVNAAEAEIVLTATLGAAPAGGRQAAQAAPLRISADPNGAALFIGGTPERIERAKQMVALIDVPSDENEERHIVRLVNKLPSDLSAILSQMESEGGAAAAARPRRGRPTPTGQPSDSVRFIPDDTGSILIVMCPAEDWPRIEQAIKELDEAAGTTDQMKKFKLVNADANEVVAVLQGMFEAGGRARRGQTGVEGIKFAVDAAGNQLFVRAGEADLEEIAGVINEIETASAENQFEKQIFPLTSAQPDDVISVLSMMYGVRQTSAAGGAARRGRGGTTTAISVDARFATSGQSIVVFAKAEKLEEIGELIASLDTKDQVSSEIRRYVLENVDVNHVARTLQDLFNRDRARGEAAPAFVPDPMGKALLVSANKDEFDRVEEVIRSFEADRQPMMFKVFDRLEYADAQSLVAVIQPMLELRLAEMLGEPAAASGSRRGRTTAGGGPSVQVQADPRGNRLLIAAPSDVMVYAEQLIASLDQPLPEDLEEPVIRTIQLKKAKASEMRDLLMGMMSGSADAAATRGAGRDRATGQPAANIGKLKGRVAMVPAAGDKAFVLRGLAEDVDAVETLIKTMDDAAVSDRPMVKQYVVMDPDVTANMILSLLDGKYQPKYDDLGFLIGPFKGQDISIFTDPYGGIMLVSAPPELYPDIEDVMALQESAAPATPKQPAKLVEVQRADPYDVVDKIEPLLEAVFTDSKTRPKIEKVPLTNFLAIRCSDEQFPQMQQLVAMLDKGGGTISRVGKLKKVSGPLPAAELVQMLQERVPGVKLNVGATVDHSYDDLIEEITPTWSDVPEEVGDAPKFAMPAALIAMRAALLAQQPTPTTVPADESSAAEPATPASSDPLSDIVSKMAAEQQPAASGELPEVQITFDPKTGALRISGPPEQVEIVEEALDDLLDELNELPLAPEIRVFRLKYISPSQAATIMESMLDAMTQASRQQQAQTARMQQLQAQRLAQQQAAQQRALQRRQQQLPTLPGAEREEGESEENGRGRDERGREREGEEDQQQGQPSAGEDQAAQQIRVYAYDRLRAVVIRATQNQWPMVLELLAKVDQQGSPVDFRVFKIARLNATDVEEKLKTLLGIEERQASRTQRQPAARTRAGQQAGTPEEELMQMQLMEGMPGMEGAGGDESVAIDWSRQVTIASDTMNNSILVAAPKQAMDFVAQLIDKIEHQTDQAVGDVVLYKLDNAEAASVADAIIKAFGGDAQSGGTSMRISADASTNTLMVWAPPHVREQIAAHVERIDSEAASRPPRSIKLAQADAELVAAKLQEAFKSSKRGERLVSIMGDKASGTLWVSAPDDIFESIKDMAPTLDLPAAPFTPQIYKLKEAVAADVLVQFKELTTQLIQMIKQSGTSTIDLEVFAASADPRTNALVVLGGPQTHALVSTVLAQIDVAPPEGAERRTMVWVLQKARASEAMNAVTNLFAEKDRVKTGLEPPVAQANESNNTLLVRGSQKQLDEIDALIKKLDGVDQQTIQRLTKIFPLQFGEPNQTASAISNAFARSGSVPDHDKVTALGEYGTRSVIVTAKAEYMTEIEKLVQELDRETATTNVTRLVTLKAARAADAVQTLTTHFNQSRAKKGSGQSPISVVANDSTNALIVSAPQNEIEDVMGMIEMLDVPPAAVANRTVEAYTLQYGNPYAIRDAIQALFVQRGGSPEDEVRAAADWGSNTLLISATPEKHAEIAEFIKKMDSSDGSEAKPRVIDVVNVDAQQVVQAIQQTMPDKLERRGQQQAQISVSNPRGTNRILVRANEADFNTVRDLVTEIDKPQVASSLTDPRIIDLKGPTGAQIAETLTRLFTEPARKEAGRTEDTIPMIMADATGSKLIVRARPADYERIVDMIAKLDTEEMVVAGAYDIIQLADGVDVTGMARTLEELINRSEQQAAQQEQGRKARLVTVRADERANALIVGGSQAQFVEVRRLAKTLEGMKPTGSQVLRVFRPVNMSVDDAKRAIEQMIEESSQPAPRGRRGG